MKEECHFSVMVAVPWDLGSSPGIYNPKNGTLHTNQDKTRGAYNFCFEHGSLLLVLRLLIVAAAPCVVLVCLCRGRFVARCGPAESLGKLEGGASSANNIVVPNADHRLRLAWGQPGEEWVEENEAPIG